MQVRDGRVRGPDLHLGRLDRSSVGLFGHGIAHERSRSYLRAALGRADSGDLSIRVNAFSREGAKVRDGIPVEPDLLVTLTDPVESAPPAVPALRLLVRHDPLSLCAPCSRHALPKSAFRIFAWMPVVRSTTCDTTKSDAALR
jgi:hypothetical protein